MFPTTSLSRLSLLAVAADEASNVARTEIVSAAKEAHRVWEDASRVLIVLLIALLAALVVGRFVAYLLRRAARPFEDSRRQFVGALLNGLARSATLMALSIAAWGVVTHFVQANVFAMRGIADLSAKVAVTLAVGYVAYCLVDALVAWLARVAARTMGRMDDMLVPLVRTSLQVMIVIFILLNLMELLAGRPVGTILAGLGIGGIAVGLAAQDTLKNVFGSIMLFGDQPFEMGDRILVDSYDGSVETVGFRSTRIRTQDGHLLTIPNGELAGKSIVNVAKRPNIRRVMNLGITYNTPPDKVRRALEILKEILSNHEGMQKQLPAQVAFNDFKDSSLNLNVVYWYHPADQNAYKAHAERVNLQILDQFNREGIEFAFPTRSVVLAGDPDNPLVTASARGDGMRKSQ